MSELKPCPYRVYGERRASMTIAGEYFYNEYFMPCMMRDCACFHIDCGDAYCDRNGSYMKLGELETVDDQNRCCEACGHFDTCARNKTEERNE